MSAKDEAPHGSWNRAEVELLLACVRHGTERERVDAIRRAVGPGIDWHGFIQLALAHAVTADVYRCLTSSGYPAIPESVLAALRKWFDLNVARNAILAEELCKAVGALTANGIRAIPYKGPVLAVSYFGAIGNREFNDLDILVHRRDFSRAAAAMCSAGYRLASELSWESTFTNDEGLIGIDIHRGLVPEYIHLPLDFDELWARSEPLELMGTPVVNLSPEDTLVLLGIQRAKDGWGGAYQLGKVRDVAEVLRASSMNWTLVHRLTRAIGAELILASSLRVARDLLHVELPPAVHRRIATARRGDVSRAQIMERMFGQDNCEYPGFRAYARAHGEMRERWRDRLYPHWYRFAHRVLIPGDKDRAVVKLPSTLSFLYYVVRPFRIVGRFLWRYGWTPIADLLRVRTAVRGNQNNQ